jgi:polysaccharide export outer membrane protein
MRILRLVGCLLLGGVALAGAQTQTGAASNSLPAPVSGAAPANVAPADYLLGPGDVVAITAQDMPAYDRTLTVGESGELNVSYLRQPVAASGQRCDQLARAIAVAMRAQQLAIDPQIDVAVVAAQSHAVMVGGAVKNPAVLFVTHPITLLDAVLRAGGPDSDHAGATVVLTRGPANDRKVQYFSYADLGTGTNLDSNPVLVGGETVVVQPGGQVFVAGGVVKPGGFPITADTPLTASKAVALAGGWLNVGSSPDHSVIVRKLPDGATKTIPVDLDKIMKLKTPDVPLQANDILYVPLNRKSRVAVYAATAVVSSLGYAAALLLANH